MRDLRILRFVRDGHLPELCAKVSSPVVYRSLPSLLWSVWAYTYSYLVRVWACLEPPTLHRGCGCLVNLKLETPGRPRIRAMGAGLGPIKSRVGARSNDCCCTRICNDPSDAVCIHSAGMRQPTTISGNRPYPADCHAVVVYSYGDFTLHILHVQRFGRPALPACSNHPALLSHY